MGLTVFQPDFSLTTATPPFQNYPHSPKVTDICPPRTEPFCRLAPRKQAPRGTEA